MKYFLLILMLSGSHLFDIFPSVTETITVYLHVTDDKDQPLIGANYQITKNDNVIVRGITDLEGKATFKIEEGNYTILVSYTGYLQDIKTGYKLTKENNKVDIKLFPANGRSEIVVTGIESKKEKKVPGYDTPGISSEMSITEGARKSKPTSITLRGYSSVAERSEMADSPLPGSGQITAGEWNDLSNWKAWKKLISGEGYSSMQSYWDINTLERYSIAVINNNNTPIPGAKVQLVDNGGTVLWTSYSDVSGKAELWGNAFNAENTVSRIIVEKSGDVHTIRNLRTVEQGSMMANLNIDCVDEIKIDIAFVVDATSSMSDEIRYLQSELMDVIDRVKFERTDIHWASVFYRDKEDAYITRKHSFTDDPRQVLDFIKEQQANGGGDFPEAVSEALEVTVEELEWRAESNVKLCFLVLDAPPHEDEISMNKYKQYLAAASAKGIKIIPVTASGINRETEFLMKFTAMLTNGTYVFITDDSGIGNPHLDPVVKDYEVEKLNDLLVRLITSYSRAPQCRQEATFEPSIDLKLYPNPATNFLNIENTAEGDLLYVISTSGKIVGKHTIQSGGVNRIDLEELISGSYILRWIKDNENAEDYPFLIIR